MDKEKLEKSVKRYEKLADKNYWLYQESGEPKYDKANEKYAELADVYRAALEYQSDHDDGQVRRLRGMSDYINEHIVGRSKDTYTKEEVLKIAEALKQFVF